MVKYIWVENKLYKHNTKSKTYKEKVNKCLEVKKTTINHKIKARMKIKLSGKSLSLYFLQLL